MKTFHFHVTVSCPLHLTFEGKGETLEDALLNAQTTMSVVDCWADQNAADLSPSDITVDDAEEVGQNELGEKSY